MGNKYRLGAYVERETYEKIMKVQLDIKAQTGHKPSQGEVLDKLLSEMEK
ncbi:Uncharacterised protein [Streptococcus pneumoniae]|jgi:hypothetical protein|nr:hypothetical protein [Streptococcus pneumoniae]VGM77966.1 Uncharacterised protein [Streptococcus pneumoniae]VQW06531.1 Uncharacterised protein [Streptococcus pneumoniae]